MNKTLILAGILLLFSSSVFSQDYSKWFTSSERDINFPSSGYYKSFVVGYLRDGEKESDLMARLKQTAMAELSSTMRSVVQGEKTMKQTQLQRGNDYANELYLKTYSKLEYTNLLVGIRVETHFDPAESEGYAFAWVNKEDLASYYKSQLLIYLNNASSLLDASAVALDSKQRARAKELCMSALEPLANAEHAQDLITVVMPSASSDDLKIDDIASLKESMAQLLVKVEQGVSVYVECTENVFGKESSILQNGIENSLTENGCSVVKDRASADFVLTVDADIREHGIPNDYVKFVYADVTLDLTDTGSSSSVCKNGFSIKGGGMTRDEASREALKAAVPEVWESISSLLSY